MKEIVKPLVKEVGALASGERICFAPLSVKTEKHLTFCCDLCAPFEGTLRIGHGKDITAGSWIEITKDAVAVYSYYAYKEEPLFPHFEAPIPHGLQIKDRLYVALDADSSVSGGGSLLLSTSTGLKRLPLGQWDGCNGEIFAEVEGATLSRCRLCWYSDGLARPLWVLGDSYISFSPCRWPEYLRQNGYHDLMLSGFPGMGALAAAEQLHRLTEMGVPEMAVGALGMNNGDTEDGINADYLAATEDFLAVCEEKGITPVLATVPNTPQVNNRHKNAWVRGGKHRYIDFAHAVGSDENEEWFEGMLNEDRVHPNELGAKALFGQAICDLPELMRFKKFDQ